MSEGDLLKLEHYLKNESPQFENNLESSWSSGDRNSESYISVKSFVTTIVVENSEHSIIKLLPSIVPDQGTIEAR